MTRLYIPTDLPNTRRLRESIPRFALTRDVCGVCGCQIPAAAGDLCDVCAQPDDAA